MASVCLAYVLSARLFSVYCLARVFINVTGVVPSWNCYNACTVVDHTMLMKL